MLEFPVTEAWPDPPLPRMSLREFARFSERCVKSNPRLVAASGLAHRADEATMEHPFSLVASPFPPLPS